MTRRNAPGILLPEGMGISGPRPVLTRLPPPCFLSSKLNSRCLIDGNNIISNSRKGKGSNNNKTNNNNNHSLGG